MSDKDSPNNPTVLQDGVENFNHGIMLGNNVLIGLSAFAVLLSLASLAVQLARPDQRILVKRLERRDGTYFLPHSPVLAPAMITIFAIISIACEVVLGIYLRSGTSRASIQRLSLLLPMPLLLWAWLSAFANAFAWHLTPNTTCAVTRFFRLKPITLNLVCWVPPVLLFAAQMAVVNVWPDMQSRVNALAAIAAGREMHLSPGDPLITEATDALNAAFDIASAFYQASWGMWAIAYGLCWVVYAIYGSLLLSLLGKQKESNNVLAGSPVARQEKVLEPVWREAHDLPDRRSSLYDSLIRTVQRKSISAAESVGFPAGLHRSISRRELLRRNSRLVWLEMLTFSIFTLCWCALATTKAAMGYRILSDPRAGPITILGELGLSTGFGCIASALFLRRGVNILRNARSKSASAAASKAGPEEAHNEPQFTVETSTAATGAPLSARRGVRSLQIVLNVGDVLVPSLVSTPLPQAQRYTPMQVPHIQLPELVFSPSPLGDGCQSSGKNTPLDGYFGMNSIPALTRTTSISSSGQSRETKPLLSKQRSMNDTNRIP